MSKKSVSKAKTPERTSPVVIGGLVVIAALVVLVLIQVGRSDNPAVVATVPAPTGIETGSTEDGHYYRGSLTAKVVVVEYEDLRCPYCQQYFLETEPQVLEQYVRTGLVREESHLIAILGSPSISAAEAAYCAGEQGKYWEFRHVAFTNQPPETTPDGRANFVKYAGQVGVDVSKFTNCFDTERYQSKVNQTTQQAQQVGVESTPTLFVNGVKYQGAIPFLPNANFSHGFKDVLDAALIVAGGG